jgi:hypothetical protein
MNVLPTEEQIVRHEARNPEERQGYTEGFIEARLGKALLEAACYLFNTQAAENFTIEKFEKALRGYPNTNGFQAVAEPDEDNEAACVYWKCLQVAAAHFARLAPEPAPYDAAFLARLEECETEEVAP